MTVLHDEDNTPRNRTRAQPRMHAPASATTTPAPSSPEFRVRRTGRLPYELGGHPGAYAQHQEIEVYGTTGRLHFLANHSGTVLPRNSEGRQGAGTSYRRGRGHAARRRATTKRTTSVRDGSIRPGDEPTAGSRRSQRVEDRSPPDFEDGLRSQQVIDARLESQVPRRRWVAVE